MFKRKYAVVLHSSSGDSIVIHPFATREEAVDHAVFLIRSAGDSDEMVRDSVESNGRNDVSIATLASPRSEIVRAS